MSATIPGALPWPAPHPDAPLLLQGEGRAFPVETRHRPRREREYVDPTPPPAMSFALDPAIADPGAVLVFLPGAAESVAPENFLGGRVQDATIESCRVGALGRRCRTAIKPAPKGERKVVLAT